MPSTIHQPKTEKLDTLYTLLGQVEATARMQNGTEQPVTIKQLTVRGCARLLEVMDDEAAMLELYCAQPAGWAVQLLPDSLEDLLAQAEALNADFFGRWLRRRLARQELFMPGLMDKLAGLSRPTATSPMASPTSPSNAASP